MNAYAKILKDDLPKLVEVSLDKKSEKRANLNKQDVVSQKKIYWAIKRIQDIVLSLVALIVLSPLLLITAVAIIIDDPKGSPIFSQERVGKDGKIFRFYKFRSMCVDAEEKLERLMDSNEKDGPVFKIKNDPRITRVGRFIRKTSIDELPQLINILHGEMSIVGPRPAIKREVLQYSEYEKQRLLVTPGLTCYWQIQPHRDEISFDKWVDLDIKYIEERSTAIDWKIILKTVTAVFTGQGE